VTKFLRLLNKDKSYLLEEKLEYKKLHYNFIKNISPKKNKAWRLEEKSILELFNEFSDLKLDNVVKSFHENKDEFNSSIKTTDLKTKFIMLESFKDVYNDFLNSPKDFDKFVNKIKKDFIKGVQNKNNCKENFEDIIRNFLNYLLN